MKTLIIEDEINAYEYLVRLIQELQPNCEIVDHIDSVQDAINWFHSNEMPELIFMDIQLSDGISFEIFNHVPVTSPIIFTTAYDQFAIQAFKVNSVDYLLKPINVEELKSAFAKLENSSSLKQTTNAYQNIIQSMPRQKKNRCLVKKGNHFEFIAVDNIMYIHSDDSLTFLHTKNGLRHIYSKTIKDLIESLDPDTFFQINRKQVIHINAIEKIHPFLNQRLKLDVKNGKETEFVVSRNRMSEFKNWVDS